MRFTDIFTERYHHEPQSTAFCPYRICPNRAHIDHQLCKIIGMVIDRGIYIAYGLKQKGDIELISLNFPKRSQFRIRQIPETKQNEWADHLQGATLTLSQKHSLHIVFYGIIEGTLLIGVLPSLIAIIITFLYALRSVNDINECAVKRIETINKRMVYSNGEQ